MASSGQPVRGICSGVFGPRNGLSGVRHLAEMTAMATANAPDPKDSKSDTDKVMVMVQPPKDDTKAELYVYKKEGNVTHISLERPDGIDGSIVVDRKSDLNGKTSVKVPAGGMVTLLRISGSPPLSSREHQKKYPNTNFAYNLFQAMSRATDVAAAMAEPSSRSHKTVKLFSRLATRQT